MAEPTENGILQYLESVLAPENAKTFTEQQTGLGREGFRKYIPDPTQVADYLQDIGDFVSASAQQVADTDQEFMDEYYGEYPEKSTNTALGILSAFPAAGIGRLLNFIKNPAGLHKAQMRAYNSNLLSDPFLQPFLQTLGLGSATLGSGIEMRERREKEAKEMGISLSEHPDFQKKANGGEISDPTFLQEIADRRTNTPSFDPEEYDIPPLPAMSASDPDDRSIFSNLKGGGLNAVLLDKYPELADNPVFNLAEMMVPRTLGESAFELATMYPPLFWMKALKPGSKAYRQANKHQRSLDRLKQKNANKEIANSKFRRNEKAMVYHQSRINDYVSQSGIPDDQIQKQLNVASSSDPTIGTGRRDFLKTVERIRADEASKKAGTGGLTTKYEDEFIPQPKAINIPESELMPPGYKTGDELLDDYNTQFSSALDSLMPSKNSNTINTDKMSMMEILQKMKDMDLD